MTIWTSPPLRQDSRGPCLPPTPGPECPAIRRRLEKERRQIFLPSRNPFYGLIQPTFVAEAHHFLDEERLLLVVEAREQGLGRIGHRTLIRRAIVEKLGLVAHLLDDVVGRVALGAGDPKIEALGAIVAEIVHGAVERRPALFLFRPQMQLGLDPGDTGIAVRAE